MRIFIAILGAGLALGSIAEPAQGQVRAQVVLDRDGFRSVNVAIGQRYGVPVHVVERHVHSRLHPDEMPVVYLLAREARVSPQTVIELRERGWSWIDITHQLRVNPRVFVAHLHRQGPPWGQAHGYWKRPRDRDLRRMSDRQVIDYVNLQFWSDYHRQPVQHVVVLWEQERSWTRMAQWDGRRYDARRIAPAVATPRRAVRAPQPRVQTRAQPERRAVERAPQYKEQPAVRRPAASRERDRDDDRGRAASARGAQRGTGGNGGGNGNARAAQRRGGGGEG